MAQCSSQDSMGTHSRIAGLETRRAAGDRHSVPGAALSALSETDAPLWATGPSAAALDPMNHDIRHFSIDLAQRTPGCAGGPVRPHVASCGKNCERRTDRKRPSDTSKAQGAAQAVMSASPKEKNGSGTGARCGQEGKSNLQGREKIP